MDYQNDNELIEMVSDNSEEARDYLYNKYSYIVDIIINKYRTSASYLNVDMNDLRQEALLGFSDALVNYNQDKDTSLSTFISLCVERRVGNYIRKYSTNKMKQEGNALSLDMNVGKDEDLPIQDVIGMPNSNPETKMVDKEETERLNREIKEALSPSEYEIYELLINDFSYEDIAKITNKQPKQVYNMIYRIRSKVKDLL